jgi:hypothetical protein
MDWKHYKLSFFYQDRPNLPSPLPGLIRNLPHAILKIKKQSSEFLELDSTAIAMKLN